MPSPYDAAGNGTTGRFSQMQEDAVRKLREKLAKMNAKAREELLYASQSVNLRAVILLTAANGVRSGDWRVVGMGMGLARVCCARASGEKFFRTPLTG